jgi:hypothetical protein
MPFLRGRNLVRIVLKSGRSSGFSAQHSARQSRTKSKLFSRSSSCGLWVQCNINRLNYTRSATRSSHGKVGKINKYRNHRRLESVTDNCVCALILLWHQYSKKDTGQVSVAGICTWEVLCSNLSQITDYSHRFSWYSSVPACSLVCWTCFFDPEDGGDMFLQNVGWNSKDYTASYLRRWYSSSIMKFANYLEKLN